jgi:hypothetical protein
LLFLLQPRTGDPPRTSRIDSTAQDGRTCTRARRLACCPIYMRSCNGIKFVASFAEVWGVDEQLCGAAA